jgi:hypothetical protein
MMMMIVQVLPVTKLLRQWLILSTKSTPFWQSQASPCTHMWIILPELPTSRMVQNLANFHHCHSIPFAHLKQLSISIMIRCINTCLLTMWPLCLKFWIYMKHCLTTCNVSIEPMIDTSELLVATALHALHYHLHICRCGRIFACKIKHITIHMKPSLLRS